VTIVRKDFRGQDPQSYPIMEGIKDTRDFALVVDFVSGNPGIQEWVRQVQGPLGIKIAAGAVTVNVPTTMPFVQSGQVIGLLQGLRGAAEYELLMESPGPAVAKMDGTVPRAHRHHQLHPDRKHRLLLRQEEVGRIKTS
jgi:hypothetical protein